MSKRTKNEKIRELTPEQWRRIELARDEWLRVGLSTERADRATTERSITELYRRLGTAPPRFLWWQSPLAACVLTPIYLALTRSDGQLYGQLDGQLDGQLAGQLRGQLDGQLRDLAQRVFGARWSNYWLSWHAHCATVRDVAGVTFSEEENAHLQVWLDLWRSCGWFFVFDGLVVCAERPTVVSFDDERRLHSETGPAVAFADGWAVHAWHGQRIPSEWIEKRDELTPQTAITWANVEQRRAACEIVGWARVLEGLHARVVDEDANPYIGTLLRVDLPDSPEEQFLKVTCGTGRTFALPVPPNVRTARAAQLWMYPGLTTKDLNEFVRT